MGSLDREVPHNGWSAGNVEDGKEAPLHPHPTPVYLTVCPSSAMSPTPPLLRPSSVHGWDQVLSITVNIPRVVSQ